MITGRQRASGRPGLWYQRHMLRLVAPILLALTLACGDSSPPDTAGTTMPDALGVGEPCAVDDDHCKDGLVCAGNPYNCNNGFCTPLCDYDGTQEDSTPGDPGCPTVDGVPSFCRLLATDGPRACIWYCDVTACPTSLAQSLFCDSGSCNAAEVCEAESG